MILVDIYVPSIGQSYDFGLDENTEVGQLIPEIVQLLSKKIGAEKCESSAEWSLFSRDRGRLLPPDRTLFELEIGDGSRLLVT